MTRTDKDSFLRASQQASGIDLRKLAARQLLPMGFAVVLVVLMWDRVQGLDVHQITAGVRSVGPLQWLAAAGFTLVSFWAVGRYDVVGHRLSGSSTPQRAALRTGMASIAVAQTVGFGVISGAFVRWRMLPDLSLVQAFRLSATVAATFVAGWAVVAALVILLIPLPLPGARLLALSVLALATLLVALSLWRPGVLARVPFPPLKAMGAIVALTFIDTAAAGAALWVLLPEGTQVAPLIMIAAFIVALGVGLVSGTPGGAGPFEMTLLALLPHLPEEPVLAAVLAFRAVYYAAPALIGAAVVIRGPRGAVARDPALDAVQEVTPPALSPHLDGLIARAPRAEANLLRHGCFQLFESPGVAAAMTAPVGQSLVFLSDPLTPEPDLSRFLDTAQAAARARFLTPFLYKSSARLAVAARRKGWTTLPWAREAWLTPGDFSTEGSHRRQLRRKLRKADSAGISISAADNLPLAEMDSVARAWAQQRGGERGFSMGLWDPATLPWAKTFLARRDGKLIAFLTLHANQREWTLDLMRQSADAPDGTMHLLLTEAIRAAADAGVARLSLAAVPLGAQPDEPGGFHRLRRQIDRLSGAEGLRQFKTCFSPDWEVLYIAAPTRAALMLGALDVLREISARRSKTRR